MRRLSAAVQALLAGPIQVRELRATFRGWRFMIIFTASLTVAMFIIWVTAFAMMADRDASSEVGQVTFAVLLTIQTGLIGLLLPGFAGTSIVRERDQATLELLATTTIRPWQIVWGQLMAAMGYVAVYLFATLPLMAFPLWFGGLVGWEPVVAYAGLFLMAALIAMWCIYVSATSASIARATIMSYLFVFLLGGPLLGGLVELIEQATRGRGSLSDVIEVVSSYAGAITLNAAYGFLAPFAFLFIVAVNRLKPPGSDRATAVRLYTLGSFPATAALCLWNVRRFYPAASFGDRSAIAYALWLIVVFYGTALAFMATEGPLEGKRLVKRHAGLRDWKYALRVLAPGGLRAGVFTLALFAAVAVVAGSRIATSLLADGHLPYEGFLMMLIAGGAQVAFAVGLGLYVGSLRLSPVIARTLWFLGIVFVPVAGTIWQLAMYGDFPDVMSWDAPGYLVFPWILFKIWETWSRAAPMPEFRNHVPIYEPYLMFHYGAGLLLGLVGAFNLRRLEREERERVLGPQAPAAPAVPAPPAPAAPQEPAGDRARHERGGALPRSG